MNIDFKKIGELASESRKIEIKYKSLERKRWLKDWLAGKTDENPFLNTTNEK